MYATINIDSELLTQAKALAAKEKRAFQSVIAEGLSLVLGVPFEKKKSRRLKLITSSVAGGIRKGVDLNSNTELRNMMDFS